MSEEIPSAEEMAGAAVVPNGLSAKEPVAISGAVVAVVTAVVNLGVLAGWWKIDNDQLAQANTAIVTVLSLAAGWWARRNVWSKQSVSQIDPAALNN